MREQGGIKKEEREGGEGRGEVHLAQAAALRSDGVEVNAVVDGIVGQGRHRGRGAHGGERVGSRPAGATRGRRPTTASI